MSPSTIQPRGSNQEGLRQFNERVVLQALRVHGALPKAALARLTGLTAQTIGLICARLEAEGLVLKQAPQRGKVGQPSVPINLNPEGAYSIGIQVGRRRADWLLVDFLGQVRAQHRIDYDYPQIAHIEAHMLVQTKALKKQLGKQARRLVGVGLAAPFLMGGWHRLLGLAPEASREWQDYSLVDRVQSLLKQPVSFARDTVAASVAELMLGRGKTIKSYLYFFVDTFVGGALVINSQLYVGMHGNAGAVASLPMGLARQLDRLKRPERPEERSPDQLLKHASLWDLEQRFVSKDLDPSAAYDERAMQAGFLSQSQAWLRTASNALAHAITSGTAFLDVDAVVIDMASSTLLLGALIELTDQVLTQYNFEGLWRPKLYAGTMGHRAHALGVALLPMQDLFSPDHEVILKG